MYVYICFGLFLRYRICVQMCVKDFKGVFGRQPDAWVEFITPNVQMWSTCRFDQEKKAWDDKIGNITEDDAGPCVTRLKGF